MKTPRILFFSKPNLWLSLLCTSAMLLTACGGGSGEGANGVSGTGLGLSNISVNGTLAPAQAPAQTQTQTSGSDDTALINSQRDTAPKTLEAISFALGSSNSNAQSVKWQFGTDANDVVGGGPKQIQTVVLSGGVIPSVNVAFKSAGIKTVTSTLYSTIDASGTPLSTETIRMYVAAVPVLKTASITGASSANTSVSNGSETTGNSLTLSGNYSSDLGTDYSVQVFDGASPLGAATPNTTYKTWTYNINLLSNDSHSFTALVKRTSDSAVGKASDAWTVKKGNTAIASNSNRPIAPWDEFTLTLSNVWNNVTSVVYTFIAGDMADGMTTQTASFVSNAWQTVTTAFKTVGSKDITADFKNSNGAIVTTRNITVNVAGTAAVTQTATIIDVKDGSTTIENNGSSANFNLKPTISGRFPTPLNKYYSLKLYDNGTPISGAPIYTPDNNNKTAWSFTSATAFSAGTHVIKAAVVRLDAVEGAPSAERTFTVSRYSQIPKAGGVYDITDCVKDSSTGLIWEGKPAPDSGVKRDGLDPNGTYTNYLNDTSITNALGYVNAVNATRLCGFTNWRLPTKDELNGILGEIVYSGLNIYKTNDAWFPNTGTSYWTSSPYAGETNPELVVIFIDLPFATYGGSINLVRLVRGP